MNQRLSNVCPASLEEAVEKSWALLSDSDKKFLALHSSVKAGAALHLTLGHRLRAELGLWGQDTDLLFDEINKRLPDHLAVDGDTASAALIDLLWQKARDCT